MQNILTQLIEIIAIAFFLIAMIDCVLGAIQYQSKQDLTIAESIVESICDLTDVTAKGDESDVPNPTDIASDTDVRDVEDVAAKGDESDVPNPTDITSDTDVHDVEDIVTKVASLKLDETRDLAKALNIPRKSGSIKKNLAVLKEEIMACEESAIIAAFINLSK